MLNSGLFNHAVILSYTLMGSFILSFRWLVCLEHNCFPYMNVLKLVATWDALIAELLEKILCY